MSQVSAVSAIERGDLSELQHILEESEWDVGSEPLNSKGQTALHIACANGHLDIVQHLVNKKKCSLEVKDDDRYTPLLVSFINEHWKVANFVLKISSDLVNNELANNNEQIVMELFGKALIASCKEGYYGLIKYLTKWHIVDYKETTQLARYSDNLHIVKYLLTHCQCTMPDDMSEAHIACVQGDVEAVKTALDSNGSSILGTGDSFNTTPVHYATLEPNLLKVIVQYAGVELINIIDSMGNTPLHHSIKYECIESVTILVRAPGCDVNLANLEGETPLIAACKHGNSDIVQLLLKCKRCDPNTSDNEGNTALHIAVSSDSSDQLENVQCLLQSDICYPNIINKSGHTPLHIVCHRGEVPSLKALVADKRCNLNMQDVNGDTALHIGVENVKVVKHLLESDRSKYDIYNIKGLTPFHKAIVNGVMASVEVMLKSGVNILQTTNDEFQNAPIHIACIHSRLDILKVLLCCANCDPNQQTVVGDTALHIVCRMRTGRELQFLEVLTSTPGINPTLVNHEGVAPFEVTEKDGNTLFHDACAEGNAALVEFLIKKGVDTLKSNRVGDAPIHIACKCSQPSILRYLLMCKNCDPNQRNAEGNTALHIVYSMRTSSQPQFLEVLTSTPGINPTLVNHEGIVPLDEFGNDDNTLLHFTCAEGYLALTDVLLVNMKNGADVLKPDKYGNAPIHIACIFSRLSILKSLLGCTDCDPNQQNAKGDTALHIVCRMRTGRELQFLEVLTSTPGINLLLVNHEGVVPFEVVEKDGNTLFHAACAKGNAELVEFLMKKGVDILKSNREGDAPIHTACKYSQMNVLNILLSCKNCDPNQQNAVGDTALHIVCRIRNGRELQFLEVLISTPGINPTLVNHEGVAPCDVIGNDGNAFLHVACVEGNTAVAELLVKNGADVLKLNRRGDAPIHVACIFGRLSIWKVLLECTNCDPNQQNAVGDTALHIVCRMRTGSELKFFEVLISTPGINPTLVNHEGIAPCDVVKSDGNTLLHVACFKGNITVAEFLVKNGADVSKLNRHGDAPIHVACKHSRLEVLKALFASSNCNPDQLNVDGDTALHIVSRKRGSSEVINEIAKILVKSGGNVLKLNRQGDAPIHIACSFGRLSILKVLLECTNCDPNQQNAVGDTALHIVCRMRTGSELKFLEVLTSTPGINPTLVNHEGIAPCDVVDSDGNTLLQVACLEGNITVAELLVKNGADVMKPNTYGDAPIHIACKHSRLEVLKALFTSNNCNPDQLNVDGDTALHIVSRKSGSSEVINEIAKILVKGGGNVLKLNRQGDAPIHIACSFGRLSILKFLLECKNCDPNQQNAVGDTALHIVCRMRTGQELQFLEVLTSTPGINPTLVNHEGIAPFEVVDSDGNTLLHVACTKRNSKIVTLLLRNGADVLKPNRHGNAPIHIACRHSRLDTLKEIVALSNCNPNQQTMEGNTALHIVCRMRTDKVLKFLEVLTSTPGINPTLINHEGIAPFEVVTKDGNTLLHAACAEGSAALVKFLMKKGVDIQKSNRQGDAPIHIACKHARLDALKPILNCNNCSPNQRNARGDTALHIVCREKFHNEKQLLHTLISTVGIDPEIVNHEGHTPIAIKGISYSAIETIKKFLDHKKSSIQAYLKIFVVGNSGTGKSTLIKAVTTEASQWQKYIPLSNIKYVNPSDVPPYTAGIVPIPFNSKHFGNAVLYDFAGQHEYYSSHAAVMENLILPSPPLFLLLIDISKSKEVIREELVYWWHFINNQSQKAAAPPHVILAGSHKDMVKSGDKEEVEIMVKDCIKNILVTFKFVGYFPLNCRKLVSQGLNALLTQLNITCQTLRGIVDVKLHCHILNALLRAPGFQDLVYCKLVDIMNKIESDDAPLPKTFSHLIPLLKSLNDQGYILLLQNHTDESKSWVILKPDVLLTEVNGSVFAPEGFREHFQFAMSTGVVTTSKLKQRFTVHDNEVIAAYLTHLEFCFRIKDQHTLDMITNNEAHKSAATEEYYFFPALVRVDNPTYVCQPHQSIGYECGWLYKCSKDTEQLTTRFLHVLILRLAFACKPPDDPIETVSAVLLRTCSVWKHGIAWWTNDGIEVIVEVGLQCRWVAVMMRCPNVKMVKCAELRSKVIHTVLKSKRDFCPAITMTEYLIGPSSLKYPFEGRELTLYSLREVAAAAIEGNDFARDTEGNNLITIPELLPFEPYHNMGDLVPKFFSGDTSVAVTSEELTQIAVKCHKKLEELNTTFKPDVVSFQRECEKADCTEVERCVALFHILQRRGRFNTWRDFQLEFSRFSIFCEQSPLERAGRPFELKSPLVSLPSPLVNDEGMVTPLGDDKHEDITSDYVRVSEEVPRSLSSPVPTQSHTSTDSTSEIVPTKERFTESIKESHSQPKTHVSGNATDQAVTARVLLVTGPKQYSKEENISDSAANISSPDVLPTYVDNDIHNSENAGLKPSMKDLANQVIPTVCPMWRDIGLQLNLDISVLNEIRANSQGDVRECCTIMFEKWLKQDTEASWQVVFEACRKVKDNLSSGPDEPCTRDHIKALTLLISTLTVFLTTL